MKKKPANLMVPKLPTKKKRKKHHRSILQPKEEKYCYLCAKLYGDYRIQRVQEHHICPGTANRAKSEELGLKVNLCDAHHEHGPEAVHGGSRANAELLMIHAQRAYEETHTREEWMWHIGKNYL